MRDNSYSIQFLWLLPLIVPVLSGCPKREEVKGRSGVGLKGRSELLDISPLKILKEIKKKAARIKTAEGYAKLRIYKKNGRRTTYRLFFQIKRPDKISLHFTLAMQPVVMAVSDGEKFYIYYLTKNELLIGDKKDFSRVFSEFIPPQIRLRELVPILLGEFPIPDKKPEKIEKKGPIQIVRWKGPGEKISIAIETEKREFRWLSAHYRKKTPLKIEYGTFRGSPPFPKRIKFIDLKRKRRFHWIYSRFTLNKEIADKSFQLDLAQLKRDNPALKFYRIGPAN